MNEKSNNVNHPKHYTNGKIECIDALESATIGLEGIEAVDTGAAIKYLWRWKLKGGVEDLKKAIWYIKHLIKSQGEIYDDESKSEPSLFVEDLKISIVEDEWTGKCPRCKTCNHIFSNTHKYCHRCGQKLKWYLPK